MEDRCLSCLNTGHALRDCKKGKKMHKLLASLQLLFKGKPITAGYVSSAMAGTGSPVMVPAQAIKNEEGKHHNLMFDTGSQIKLITRECAKDLGAKEVGESTLII